MANDNILTGMFDGLQALIVSQVGGNVANVLAVISPVFAAGVLVYFVYVAYSIIHSEREFFLADIMKNMAALACVMSFTFGAGLYATYVIPFAMNAGDELSAAVSASPISSNALDGMLGSVAVSIENISKDVTFDIFGDFWPSLKLVFAIFLVGVGSSIFIFFAAAYLLVSKFLVGVLVSLGPIFICFSFFPSTRGFFTSWCGMLLNFLLMNISFTIVLGILNQFIVSKFKVDDLGVTSATQIILIFLIAVFVLFKLDQMIAGLTGGMTIHGLADSVMKGAKGAGGGAVRGGSAAYKAGKQYLSSFKNSIKGG